MDIQLEKSTLINVLQNINDISIIQRVRNFVMQEIEPISLSISQVKELDKRLLNHRNNPNEGIEASQFLDKLKLKQGL